jgi:hypothetical protein
VATEAHLPLARLRTSVLRHARLLGYRATEGANARVFVALEAALDRTSTDPPLLPAGTRLLTSPPQLADALDAALPRDPEVLRRLLNAGARVFETLEAVTELRTARNRMLLHSWGESDCCLPAGATAAHLVGTAAGLGLQRGDALLLEERVPPGGSADDPPDPAHRQIVRLSAAPVELRDHLLGVDVLEVRWHDADALRFPLNLQGAGGRPGAVAAGNLVLADHGRTLDYADPDPADLDDVLGEAGLSPSRVPARGAYRPRLRADSLIHAAPYDPLAARENPVSHTLAPALEDARPQVWLRGAGETWTARGDLLASDRFAPDFVVEPFDEGSGRVRFGDGRFGKLPDPDADFTARIRSGRGPDGNIGAEAIGHVLTDDPDLIAGLRNPLPAVGGSAPESATTIKINASRAFRRQRRAVTPQDYADAAEAFGDVQRAMAERRWTGSWHTLFLTVDRLEGRPVDAGFEAALREHLAGYRLAGHDLEVLPPLYAPLDLALLVCVAPDHYAADTERALHDAFSSAYRRDGRKGFFHPDNFSFGEPVRLSRVVATAMEVPGVDWVGMRLDDGSQPGRFTRLDRPGTDYTDAGEIPIGIKEVARLDNDPNAPDNGRIRFDMRGGL